MKNVFVITLFLACVFTVSAQSNVAHLNSQEVIDVLASNNLLELKIEEYEAELRDEINVLKTEFDEAISRYTTRIRGCCFCSPILLKKLEDELVKKEQELMRFIDSAPIKLKAYEDKLYEPLIELCEKAILLVAERNNYDGVYDVKFLMIHNGPDITKEVIAEITKLEQFKD